MRDCMCAQPHAHTHTQSHTHTHTRTHTHAHTHTHTHTPQTTLTTTGYGEIVPLTYVGKFVAGILMLFAMVTLALPISGVRDCVCVCTCVCVCACVCMRVRVLSPWLHPSCLRPPPAVQAMR